ncbi:MAG: MYXO-CTERM sorting domain-containing protein [Myxococcota bacterium]|jgi:hypothetical protein|nr:MYXO-CTERM sorting domain-containing protein [Myxococcota bacterium]
MIRRLLPLALLCVVAGINSLPAQADVAGYDTEAGSDDTNSDGDEDEGACGCAAVNSTNAMSLGLGLVLLAGLRRKQE